MIDRNRFFLLVVFVVVLGFFVPVSAANSMAVDDGNGQSATVGEDVEDPPAVIIKDSNGAPISGISVSFEVTEGGGSVSPASVTTDDDGVAAVTRWTLGTTAGSNKLRASLDPVNVTTPSTLTFTATGTA